MWIAAAPRFSWGYKTLWRIFPAPELCGAISPEGLAERALPDDALRTLRGLRSAARKLLRDRRRDPDAAFAEVFADGTGNGTINVRCDGALSQTDGPQHRTYTIAVSGEPFFPNLPRYYTMRSAARIEHVAIEERELIFTFDAATGDGSDGGLVFSRVGVRHWGPITWIGWGAPDQYMLCTIDESQWLGGVDAVSVTPIGNIRSPIVIAFPQSIATTFQLFLFWLVAEHELLRLFRT